MKKLQFLLFICLLILVTFTFNSCTEDQQLSQKIYTKDFNADVPLKWNELIIQIDRYATGFRPPAAARMFAYTGMAVYESVVPGMPDNNSLAGNYYGLNLPIADTSKDYYWPACANAAYAYMLKSFYSHLDQQYIDKITQLEFNLNNAFTSQASSEVLARSVDFGQSIAKAVFEYSKTDTYGNDANLNPRPSEYDPPKIGPNGEKLWQPTYPDYTRALFPYWGKVRTFALTSSDIIAKPPLQYSEDPESKFYQQANEVRIAVNKLSLEDKWISEFWSDDFFELTFEPSARQLALANQIVVQNDITLDKAVELYAKMGMAMSDAAVAIWNSKYIYNVLRPVQYIRDLMDPNWKTVLNHPTKSNLKGVTPEFPSYPSGHSGFGGAGSVILTDIFGNSTYFVDNCHKDRTDFLGTPRAFNSFIDAGIENAYSRITLGVHFRMDCDEGLRLGYLAAHKVIALNWHKK